MDTAEKAGLEVRRMELADLHVDPSNARFHGPENMASIEASLQRFGQAEPLVVHAPTSRIIGGNGRFVAMKKLGWTECDVVALDVDDLTATALGIALNRTGELAEWDDDALGGLLRQLQAEGALEGVGFDDEEIQALLDELGDDDPVDLDDDGPGELPSVPVSRDGDLWVLGEHRLLVGDSGVPGSYVKLLGDEKVDLIWTDPPYGVSYVGKTSDALEIQNDALEGEALQGFLDDVFRRLLDACRPGACWYVAAPSGPNFLHFAVPLTRLKVWRQTLVWVKDVFVLGRSDFHYRHEALFYGWAPGAAHQAPPSRDLDTVWEIDRPKASPDHPTTKPVELVTRAILASSRPGDLVLDPFVGSGTVVLAAESTGRRARAIEIDPRYADVVLERWMEATGKQAELGGRGFDAIALERQSDE